MSQWFAVDRTLFRSFDENADGTVSQNEFRKGIANLGIEVSDDEFAELMETLDEVFLRTTASTLVHRSLCALLLEAHMCFTVSARPQLCCIGV